MKLAGIFTIILLVVGGLFYWYFLHSQDVISQLNANNAKLTVSVEEQKTAINALQTHAQEQATQVTDLQKNLNSANEYRVTLEKLLRDHDLTALARAKPKLIEDRMNAATDKVWKDLEALTGGTNAQ